MTKRRSRGETVIQYPIGIEKPALCCVPADRGRRSARDIVVGLDEPDHLIPASKLPLCRCQTSRPDSTASGTQALYSSAVMCTEVTRAPPYAEPERQSDWAVRLMAMLAWSPKSAWMMSPTVAGT